MEAGVKNGIPSGLDRQLFSPNHFPSGENLQNECKITLV